MVKCSYRNPKQVSVLLAHIHVGGDHRSLCTGLDGDGIAFQLFLSIILVGILRPRLTIQTVFFFFQLWTQNENNNSSYISQSCCDVRDHPPNI